MTYYLDFKNDTDEIWTMVVYQELPDSPGIDSVAWKKTTVPHNGESGVEWEIEYLVALANYKQTGGIDVYKASQKINNIPLGSKWKVIYDATEGVQVIERDGDAERPELIRINNYSNRLADVGVGMSGEASNYKKNVKSGSSNHPSGAQFKMTPTYYVGLCNKLKLGTVMSSVVVVGPFEIKFPSGMNHGLVTASLNGANIEVSIDYDTTFVSNYEQVQTLSRSIGSEFQQVLDEDEIKNGSLKADIDYVFGAKLIFGSLTVAIWAYENRAFIARAANVVIDNFSSFDRAARTFKVVGQSALACAAAMDAIVKAIKDNAPSGLLQEGNCESSDRSSVDYTDLTCYK